MTEIDFAIGYGVVISKEVFEAVADTIEDIDDRDDWENEWAACLNSWREEKYFVGITYHVLNFDNVITRFDKDKFRLNPKDAAEFLKFYNKYHLEEFFEWVPDCCAIAFVW